MGGNNGLGWPPPSPRRPRPKGAALVEKCKLSCGKISHYVAPDILML